MGSADEPAYAGDSRPRTALVHAVGEPCTSVRVPFVATATAELRREMVAELASYGLDPALIAAAELVLGELAANAVEHGAPLPSGDPTDRTGELEVGWCVVMGHLRVTVLDGGSARELRPTAFDAQTLRGRGLQIVDTVCDRWTHDDQGGTRVIAELDTGSASSAYRRLGRAGGGGAAHSG